MSTGAPAGTEAKLESYLHEHIPLSAAMGVTVVEASPSGVRLRAPLGPNINHRSTVFGGSASAVAILAGWALLHTILRHDGHGARIVIQTSSVDYLHPISGDFEAIALPPAQADLHRFARTLERRGRGRIDLSVELEYGGREVGNLKGSYVVVPEESVIVP